MIWRFKNGSTMHVVVPAEGYKSKSLFFVFVFVHNNFDLAP
jgi:hypothetical protein